MTNVRVGDEVEVRYVYRGVVETVGTGAAHIRLENHDGLFPVKSDEAAVTVIRKAPLKAGDKLTTVEELRALKRNAVIQHRHFHAIRTDKGKFVDEMGLHHRPESFSADGTTLSSEVTLVALPPEF